jgi:hypothetical protein
LKNFKRSRIVATVAISALAVGCVFFFNSFNKKPQDYDGDEFNLRRLGPVELSLLSREGLNGNCASAYKVAQHHMYYSLDEVQATKFYRLAARCPNPNAEASLITLLAGNQAFDAEVDASLAKLKKLDPKLAEGASIEIIIRRGERRAR